ncbi:MAG: hypothetical protein AAFU65_08120 [Pseudomonadota bacterium]
MHGAAALLLVASALTSTASLANQDATSLPPSPTTTLIITAPHSHADSLRRTKQVDPAELRFTLHSDGPDTGYRLERSDTGSATL